MVLPVIPGPRFTLRAARGPVVDGEGTSHSFALIGAGEGPDRLRRLVFSQQGKGSGLLARQADVATVRPP
jgi:hypothetical protein